MDPTTFLLRWYDRHHRVLPWRVTPVDAAKGDVADPYRVWLSEIMLQQTTVEAVKSYFLRFIERWPTVRAMAKASEDDILRAWAGLGYYSRARNLKKCADIVVAEHGGNFRKVRPASRNCLASAIIPRRQSLPSPLASRSPWWMAMSSA